MDLGLLQIMGKRDNYVRFKPYVKDYTLSKEGKAVWVALELYYKTKPEVKEIDWHNFEAWFYIYKGASITKQNAELYQRYFTNLRAYKNDDGEKETVAHFVKLAYANKMGEVTLQILTNGEGELDDVHKLFNEYEKEVGRAISVEDLFASGDVSDVLARARTPGLNWRLPELNRSCGPLRGGDHVVVTAYVGTGKTTFLADQVSHMATQLKEGEKIIWVNNEERSDAVSLRIRSAALGRSVADISKDQAAADTEYKALMGGDANRILVLKNDPSICNVHQLNAIFNEVKPKLIVFDVLDKVEGMREREGKEWDRLGRIYKWARLTGHEHDCPVISVSQSDVSGAQSKFITMDQLRGSKVDKPGEVDLLIAIGKNYDLSEPQDVRFINIAKNKLVGGPLFEEDKRLYTWEVKLNGPIARYES